jgi:CheY-like chemotaxis protein
MDSVAHLNNTKLSYTLSDEIPTMLKSDSFKIEQILTNFIGNALKFTRDGEIVVNTTLVEKKNKHLIVRFEVSDTGIGIAEDKLDQIFKKFTQENHEISKQYGGSGLGLSICSKLSEALNGTINVESIKGVGSKFSVEVPLEIEDDQTVEMKEVLLNSESNSLSGLNILVVEDSKENVYILDFLFKKWKINYEVAKDGESSIELAKKKKFDLILMDLSLPGIDGYTAAIEINKHNAKNGKTTPMIAFSASSNSSTEDKFKLSGFSDFIEKPFKPDSLYEKMENSVK